MTPGQPLQVSAADQARLRQAEALAEAGAAGVPALVEQLGDPNWAVRRAVVGGLARLGPLAVGPLCAVLRGRRDSEARLAAAVDALSLAAGEVDEAVLELMAAPVPPPVICDAAAVLGRRGSRRAVPALARLTAHPDDNVAVAAIEALGRIGGAAAVDSLVATVAARSFFRTFPAVDVLGRVGGPASLAPLAALLDDPLYAAEATRALGHTGEPGAVPLLVPLLRRPGEATARAAASALAELADRLQSAPGQGAAERAVAAAGLDLAAVANLARAALGASAAEQAAVCRVLGWVGGDASVAALLDLLEAAPEPAARALRAAGGPRVAEALRAGDSTRRLLLLPVLRSLPGGAEAARACLADPDPAVRGLACETLARAGDVGAVPLLFERLADPDPLVAQAAVAAVQALGSERTEALALEAAGAPEPRVRRAALRVVSYFGYPQGLPVLLAAARGEDERAREIALGGLALLEAPEARRALLEAAVHPGPKTRGAAMRALGQVPAEPESGARLLAGLGDPDPWVRYYACQALGRRKEAAAVERLLPLLQDPAGQVQVAAIDALAQLPGEAALGALLGAARSPDPDVRRAALLGLGAGGRPAALPLLLEAAASAEAGTRLVAVSALAASPSPRVVPALLRLAGDESPAVRQAALGFLAARPGAAAGDALVALLDSPDLGERAAEALGRGGPGRLPLLVGALQAAGEATAPRLAAALARLPDAEASPGLLAALRYGGPPARRAAATALAALAGPEAAAALERAAVDDPDPEVRRRCTQALASR